MECSHVGNNRLIEFCPYHWDSFVGPIDGTGDETMRWMVDELKPYIDANFRTWAYREATGIGGSSMGGLMSLFAVSCYNHVFSRAAALSPCVFLDNEQLFNIIRESEMDSNTRVYLDYGSEEWFDDDERTREYFHAVSYVL